MSSRSLNSNFIDSRISIAKQEANQLYNEGKYKDAISIYSSCILVLEGLFYTHIKGQFQLLFYRAQLLNNRAQCYRKLNKYKKSLCDLNCIISTLMTTNNDHKVVILSPDLMPICAKALLRRADLCLHLGNSGRAYGDYTLLCESPFNQTNGYAKQMTFKLGLMRHPSLETSVQCNKTTLSCNIFTHKKYGWKRIKNRFKSLPRNYGHSMVYYDGTIYSFGGGDDMMMDMTKTDHDKPPLFMKISLTHGYCTWKEIVIPNQYKIPTCDYMMGVDATIHKWKHILIIFGGSDPHPFQNVLLYNPKTEKWRRMHIQNIEFELYDCDLRDHSAVVMGDKLFVYNVYWTSEDGCTIDELRDNINKPLYCLDLSEGIWQCLRNRNDDDTNPETRSDECIWCDPRNGREGSVFIGFGSCLPDDDISCVGVKNIWRYDVFLQQWFLQSMHGNVPVERSESGVISTADGVILFGGFTESLISMRRIPGKQTLFQGRWIYFADCFKYVNKSRIWKMIHCKQYPAHRAQPAMCVISRNVVALYGGYHGGNKNIIYNDLWILNLKKCKRKKYKLKFCKICVKSSNECRLYLCSKCQKRYFCSKRCQKKDWLTHRLTCTKYDSTL